VKRLKESGVFGWRTEAENRTEQKNTL